MDSCLAAMQFFFCGTIRQKGKAVDPDAANKVKIRVGFEGKDTYFNPDKLNVKTTFGQFAVLLDYSSNMLVPLNSNGFVMESLIPKRRYVVVLNTHGSSSHKWNDMRKQSCGGSPKKPTRKNKHTKKKSKLSPPPVPRSASTKSVVVATEAPVEPEQESSSHNGADEVKVPLISRQPSQELLVQTNFANINFSVSSSMEHHMSNMREIYAY